MMYLCIDTFCVSGVGYMRLFISFLGSIYSVIYLAMTVTYFLYTLSNSLPFWECIELVLDQVSPHTTYLVPISIC